MNISEAKEYARWWTQNSYKHTDGIPPRVLQAWQVLTNELANLPAQKPVKVSKKEGKIIFLDD